MVINAVLFEISVLDTCQRVVYGGDEAHSVHSSDESGVEHRRPLRHSIDSWRPNPGVMTDTHGLSSAATKRASERSSHGDLIFLPF